MSRDQKLFIKDILDNMARAVLFVNGMTYREFSKDIKTAYAVARCLEIIGEAVKHVPQGIRKEHPSIPWKEMSGMRDKVIHFYFGLNFKTVWNTVQKDIPELKPLIEKVKEDMDRK